MMDDIKQCALCYSENIYLYAEQKDFIKGKYKKVWDCKMCHHRTMREEELFLKENMKGGLNEQ